MKKYLPLLLTVLVFTACDKVPPRIPPPVPDCVLNMPIVKTNTATSGYRKVLLEDFTGHTCGNCPPAAEKAEEILLNYKDSVIVMANHVSSDYAAPINDTLYREEFRNPASNEWDKQFLISKVGLPNGTVNRMKPYAQRYSSWSSLIPVALRQPQAARLDITTMYDPDQKLLNVKVKTTFLASLPYNVRLILALTQDSLIGHQKDYGPPPGVELDEPGGDRRLKYHFDHLVIGSINGTWGDLVKASPNLNDTITISKSCNLLTRCFYKDVVCLNDRHINLVAFVYKDDGSYEVIQVEKLKIR